MGHSIPVDVELEEVEPPEELWHGTGEKYVASIDEIGLIRKSRLYVHLSKDKETALKVGSRHGRPVLYTVKTREMYQDGYTFLFIKKWQCWSAKEVPVKYLEKNKGIEKPLLGSVKLFCVNLLNCMKKSLI